MWKIITLLFFLLAIIFLIKGEYEKKQINQNIVNCNNKLKSYIDVLNESLKGWYGTIVSCGKICFNITNEEIDEYIQNNSFEDLLNSQEVIK